MSRRKNIGLVAAGILIGAALSGPTAQAAETYLQAVPSWQKIYLDGQQVQMTAYNIGGNNYVKLRDIGKAVGFNVYWQDGVQIDSDAPYTGEAPASVTAAPAADAVLVGSVKGNTLKTGERSRIMIEPISATYSVSSSNPEAVSIENVSGYWVAVAKAPGTAVITAIDGAGNRGTLTLTVEAVPEPAIDLTANMEIRLEMVRLINEVRAENGAGSLSINEALMNAAQDCSAQRFTHHNTEYECRAALKYGYPHGFSDNLTWFSGVQDSGSVAKHAVENWIKSPGHFTAMIDPDCDCIGVGVHIDYTTAYCYMFAGDPKAYNPYE